MSYINNVQQCAPNMQARLADYFTGVGYGISPAQRPFLQFVNTNVAGIKQIINPSAGKVKTIELLYRRPLMASDIDETGAPSCSGGDDLGTNLEEYTIDTTRDGGDWVKKTERVNLGDLHCTDESFADYFTAELARLIDGVDAKVSADASTALALLVGNWSKDTISAYSPNVVGTELRIDYKDSNNKYDPEKFHEISDATTMTGYNQNVVMFGGTKLNSLAKFAQAGCCSTNGVELGQIWDQFGFASVYDLDVATALGGQEYSAVVQPGAVTLLTFNEAGWKNGVPMILQNSFTYHFSVVSPKTGTPMDVKVTEDCDGVSISVAACTKLVGLPAHLFQETDNYGGVTFVNKVKAI